jgi:hypothetical protein
MTDDKRCAACHPEDDYCATYIGPLFGHLKTILFIGLDHGQGRCLTRAERASGIVEYYRDSPKAAPWNLHYKGCLWMASSILDLPCSQLCQERCAKHEQESCALLHFAQANAVKCVSSESKEMRFVQGRRIPDCLPLGFEEALELEADLLVLQSPTIEDFFYDLVRERGSVTEVDEFTGLVRWNVSERTSVILTTHHPSSYRFKGPWQVVWDRDIAPKVAFIRTLLADQDV